MIPDFGGLIWMIIAIIEAIAGISAFLLFVFWVMPPISRSFIRAKWGGHVVAFIQNETGKVKLCVSDKELPEGVVHFKRKGWFLISKRPYEEIEEEVKRGPGRPRKNLPPIPNEEDKKKIMETVETLIQAPILSGFGKQVFFGSSDSVALTNLKTLGVVGGNAKITGNETDLTTGVVNRIKLMMHANLRNSRLLAPIMYSKTQLDALATGNRLEGMKMFGRDTIKIIIIAIAGAIVIASLGIVAYMLMNSGGA